MSLSTTGMNSSASLGNSSLLLHSAVYHRFNDVSTTQAADQEHSLIDYRVPGNQLYERADGSVGLAEKSLEYVVGERILAPTIKMIHACAKDAFRYLGNGFGYLSERLSAYNFQILPTVGASTPPITLNPNLDQLEDLPMELEKCAKLLKKGPSKEVYYNQGTIYQKLGRYNEAAKSFELAKDFSSAKKALNYVEGFLKKPDPSHRVEFLKELKFDLPSHRELLSMSALVYEDFEFDNVNMGNLSSFKYKTDANKDLANELASKGWKLAKVKKVEQSGYTGMAFIHEKHKSIVVANRGTEVSSAADLDNCVQMFQGKRPSQYENAEQFVQSLSEEYPQYNFSHTGHSLGAVLAELLAYYRGEPAVTVESPGILSMISQEYLKERGLFAPIVCYLSTPNILNTCSGHIGILRAVVVPPAISSTSWFNDISTKLKKLFDTENSPLARLGMDSAEVATTLAGDASSHKINLLLESFKNEHLPYKFIRKWPKGVQERMQFNTACGKTCNPSNPHSFSSSDRHSISEIYQTEEATTTSIQLDEFSKDARDLLLNLRSEEEIPENLNPRILSLYKIQGNEVQIQSADALFTVQDFHAYIERQIAWNRKESAVRNVTNPFYECCTLEAPEFMGENKNSQESIDLLFSLPCIQGLSKFDHAKINTLIRNGDLENLEAYLTIQLGETYEKKITYDLLQNSDKRLLELNPDYPSLIDHIYSSKSHLQFLSVMHNSAEFFIGRTLYIDTANSPLFGEITDFSFSCRTLHFHLKDGNQVKVQLDDRCGVRNVICIRHVERALPFYLDNPVIGAEFDLVLSKHHRAPEWIREGHYAVLEVGREASAERIKIGSIDTQQVYTIDINYERGSQEASIKLFGSSPEKFDDFYQIQNFFKARYTTETSSPISRDNANEVIILQENFKDIYQETLKEIDQLKQQLMNALKEDPEYLQDLIEHMIEQQFGTLTDTTLMAGQKIAKFESVLKDLTGLINGINPSAANFAALLQEAAIEANYQQFTRFSGGDSVSISEAMTLFAKSRELTEKMKGKDLILFIGNTGSGRSTQIAASIGCTLERKKNAIGQRIFELEPKDQAGCPKIGQSLTSSETLFSEGFLIKGEHGLSTNLMLADTPGLGENRGNHFALSAALSIDQTFEQAKSIKALVIAFPLSAFLLDKGNGVIDLMNELCHFFPNILKDDTNSVHILVTKHSGYKEIDLKTLTVEFLKDEKSEDRKMIWTTLIHMANKGHMKLALPTAAFPTKKLLEKYASSRGINPKQFKSLLDTPTLQHQFTDYIQSAASTWQRDIFLRYLNFFTKEQARVKEIEKYEKAIKKAQAQLASTRIAINEIQSNRLGDALEKTASYQTCLAGVEHHRKTEQEAQEEIATLQARLTQIKVELEVLSAKIEEHQSGSELHLLYNLAYSPDEVIQHCNLKLGARQRANLEGRATNEQDCVNEKYDQVVAAKDYRGNFVHDIEIERDYYLAPSDRALQEEFERHGIIKTNEYQYKAIISGKHYTLDLQRRIHPNGKKITYYFKTHWGSGEIPSISVVHEEPNIAHYAISLGNWDTEKGILEKEQTDKNSHLVYQQNKAKEDREKIDAETGKCREELLSTLETQQSGLEAQVAEIQNNINTNVLEIIKDQKERRMVAVIIKTRWPVAKSLRLFTQQVVRMEKARRLNSKIGQGGSLLETCESYQKFFNDHRKEILELCSRDLGAECVQIELVEKEKRKVKEEL